MLKSTGIVILVVAVAAIIIFAIDQGLGAGVTGLKSLANRGETTTSEAAADDHDHDHDEDESTTKADSSKESTTKAASSTEGTTAEKTSESKESSASEAAK